MEYGSILKCNKCNREYFLYLGNGMISFCEEQLFDFNNKYGNIIARSNNSGIVNMHELQEFLKLENVKINKNFKNDFYYCDKCKSFEIKFYYYLRNDSKLFVPKYRCKRCNHILNHTPKKNTYYSYYCCKCNVSIEDTGFVVEWD